MKKIFSIVLTAAILLSTCVFGATAATDPNDYSENLIVHWDFEPNSAGGVLADKATKAGDFKNTLVENGTGITYADGYVTVPKTANVYLQQTGLNSADEVGNVTTGMTIGAKFNLDAEDAGSYLMGRIRTFAIGVGSYDGGIDSYTLTYYHEQTINSSNKFYDPFDACNGKKFECGKDYYIFITVARNEDGKAATATGYWSEDGVTFTKGSTKTDLKLTEDAIDENSIIDISRSQKCCINIGTLGVGAGANKAATTADMSFDDIWIFNAAVSADSLPVIAKGGFHYTDGEAKTAPAFRGSQVSPITEDKHALRLVGTVDSTSYAEVGFKVQVTDYKSASYNEQAYMTTTVYNSILGSTTNGNWITYTAAQLGGTYIYALTLEGIPTDATVTLKVTPCYKLTEDGETLTGESYTVVIENGKIVSQTVVA